MKNKGLIVLVIVILAAVGAYYVSNMSKQSGKLPVAQKMASDNPAEHGLGQKTPEGSLTEYDYTGEYGGKVDWVTGIVEMQATGPAQTSDEARTTGAKIARMKAFAKLAEFVDKVRITSAATLVDEKNLNSRITNSVEAFVRGAVEKRVQFLKLPSGSEQALVTLQLNIYGPLGLADLVRKELPAPAKKDHTIVGEKTVPKPEISGLKAVEPEKKEGATPSVAPVTPAHPLESAKANLPLTAGLVIDARSLGVMPALFPKIISASGEVIYDYSKASPSVASQKSVVSYRANLEGAKALAGFGANPMVIKAINLAGPLKADVVVSDSDAAAIQAHESSYSFMANALVAFLIKSPEK